MSDERIQPGGEEQRSHGQLVFYDQARWNAEKDRLIPILTKITTDALGETPRDMNEVANEWEEVILIKEGEMIVGYGGYYTKSIPGVGIELHESGKMVMKDTQGSHYGSRITQEALRHHPEADYLTFSSQNPAEIQSVRTALDGKKVAPIDVSYSEDEDLHEALGQIAMRDEKAIDLDTGLRPALYGKRFGNYEVNLSRASVQFIETRLAQLGFDRDAGDFVFFVARLKEDKVIEGESTRRRVDHHDNAVFAARYNELAPKFLDYDRARAGYRDLVQPNERAVEIGIGSGLFALPLIEEGLQISGIEPSASMMDLLAENAIANGVAMPSVEQTSIVDYPFDTDYDVIYSHSGPIFFTRESGNLYYEGLRIDGSREDEVAGNIAILKKVLDSVARTKGKLLLNIQENKTGIPLSDGSTYYLAAVGNGYDTVNLETTKHYEFVEKDGSIREQGGQDTYRRFACSFAQFAGIVNTIGDFDLTNYNDTWIVVSAR